MVKHITITMKEPKRKDHKSFDDYYKAMIDYLAWKFMDMEDRLKFI